MGAGEAGFVDAVVEVGHHPAVYLIDGVSVFLWVEVYLPLRVVVGQELVKGMVEHTHDILTLIVYNLTGFLVPEDGHAVFTFVVWI